MKARDKRVVQTDVVVQSIRSLTLNAEILERCGDEASATLAADIRGLLKDWRSPESKVIQFPIEAELSLS
jgi:hypothetical protein